MRVHILIMLAIALALSLPSLSLLQTWGAEVHRKLGRSVSSLDSEDFPSIPGDECAMPPLIFKIRVKSARDKLVFEDCRHCTSLLHCGLALRQCHITLSAMRFIVALQPAESDDAALVKLVTYH